MPSRNPLDDRHVITTWLLLPCGKEALARTLPLPLVTKLVLFFFLPFLFFLPLLTKWFVVISTACCSDPYSRPLPRLYL